jgi:hypothetical protein
MGSEVKWLAKGLYKRGVVIGSPSPGIAKVREHLTALTRDIPSNRLEVVESAKNVLERAIEEGRTADFVKNPALADLVHRAQESGVPLADWGKHLVPDEYQSIQDILTLTVPIIYNSLPRFGDWREQLADEVWKRIEVPAKELGFDENTGLIYAQGIGIKIIERLEREKAWASSDAFHTGLAPPVNAVRRDGRVAVAVTPITMLDILEGDGRFKTQFEIGGSGGYYDPDLRAGYEAAMFGLHPNVSVEKRTIYGYVFTPGMVDSTGVEQYGGIRVVLKDSVRDRTTMTVGDSLGTGAVAPVSMNGPDVGDKEAYMASSTMANTMHIVVDEGPEELQDFDYFEAQIHGGVTLADVEEIVILDGELEQDEIDYFTSLAAYHGIKVRTA